jgi:4-oxalocrotonate tautomerase/trans-3-chloroacrylic acid dehalogenase beta subunit
MPQLYCNIPAGVPEAKKKQMIREIIKVTHEAVGSDPKIINVVVYDIEPSNMAVNGEI